MISRILNVTGTVVIVLLIIAVLPLTLPKIFGYELYTVLSGSMEPGISVNSVIYVKKCSPETITKGDVITFNLESNTTLVETHRVVDINSEEDFFTTKGDANAAEDVTPVAFDRLIGVVKFHIPYLGFLAQYINSAEGIASCIAVFAGVLIMWLVAEKVKTKGVC